MIGGVRFARRVTATYDNPSRTDSTPCPLGPSYDAARYTGRLRAGAPSPPAVSFSVELNAIGVAVFKDTTNPGSGKGGRVVSRQWSFGDPASGTLDGARSKNPTHQFSAPGDYQVKLTETDAAGLRASASRLIVIP
jgi:PKD repeat protein